MGSSRGRATVSSGGSGPPGTSNSVVPSGPARRSISPSRASIAFRTTGLVRSVNWAMSRAEAGPNPWNADSLEWDVESPPPSYGVLHIPEVTSRHPLWDPHDESEDPHEERLLDHSRLTLATTWLAAEPRALSQMPEDTLAPLVLALVLTAWFTAILLKLVWIALGVTAAALLVAGWWLWPKPEKHVT